MLNVDNSVAGCCVFCVYAKMFIQSIVDMQTKTLSYEQSKVQLFLMDFFAYSGFGLF